MSSNLFNTTARTPGNKNALDPTERAFLYEKAMEIVEETEKQALRAARV